MAALMAGALALALAWGRGLVPLLLLLLLAAPPGAPGLRHSYDCGAEGMQLLVLPPEGRTVRFKVMDEFGNQFEVNNCSSCYHWVTAKPEGKPSSPLTTKAATCWRRWASRPSGESPWAGLGGPSGTREAWAPPSLSELVDEGALSPGHQPGCGAAPSCSHLPSHLQAGRSHLSVFVEALLPDGRVDEAQNLTLVCPKPAPGWTTPDGRLVPSASFSLSTPHTRELPPTAEPSVSPPTPASSALGSGPTPPTWAGAQGGTVETWGADKPEDTGSHALHFPASCCPGSSSRPPRLPPALGTRPSPEQCRGDSGHIPCLARGSSKEACQQAGCCYDNTRDVPCYYGNTATVQCSRDGHFVLAVSRETALAHRVTLATETESFLVFHFPFTHCGTTVVGNQLIYENQLVSDMDVQVGPRGAVTRDGSFRLQARCVFNGSDFLPVQAAVLPPAAPASVAQPGPLRLELRIAKDETFGSYFGERDYPLVRRLLEPVPVEDDPRLALVLHRCWAAPGASPFQQPQWPLLSDGCPFEGDSYRTRLVALDGAALPFPAHYQRFTVATFAFLNASSGSALRGPVYFFCSASACSPSGLEPCSAPCGSRTARQRRAAPGFGDTAEPQDVASSPGPVGFVDSYRQEPAPGPAGSAGNSDPRLLLGVALLLAAVALVLGVGVFVGLSRAPAPGLLEGGRG
ncbi:hypothetical protein QTO34_003190 [Cnephaeus nilssonii]|uniref:Zona pellucida sperm-binding protein 1 n=1 Tax=Cnephaeus nilssonii TaxID=3371016 RepID=A0AA40HQA8_CNENI|nr:hypothetical protein QTO34_003190 [Eptesicus nilssonii]